MGCGLLALACHGPSEDIALPTAPAGARTLILASSTESDVSVFQEIVVLDLLAGPKLDRPLFSPGELSLSAWYYRAPPAELHVRPGTLQRVDDECGLPRPEAGFNFDSGGWVPDEEGRHEEVRVPSDSQGCCPLDSSCEGCTDFRVENVRMDRDRGKVRMMIPLDDKRVVTAPDNGPADVLCLDSLSFCGLPTTSTGVLSHVRRGDELYVQTTDRRILAGSVSALRSAIDGGLPMFSEFADVTPPALSALRVGLSATPPSLAMELVVYDALHFHRFDGSEWTLHDSPGEATSWRGAHLSRGLVGVYDEHTPRLVAVDLNAGVSSDLVVPWDHSTGFGRVTGSAVLEDGQVLFMGDDDGLSHVFRHDRSGVARVAVDDFGGSRLVDAISWRGTVLVLSQTDLLELHKDQGVFCHRVTLLPPYSLIKTSISVVGEKVLVGGGASAVDDDPTTVLVLTAQNRYSPVRNFGSNLSADSPIMKGMTTRRRDARSLDHATLEEMRKQAVARV
ncbi:MAG: hypothetical protein HY791_05160, partial [Deltaproteobacteria bacterium]|nr:hypothetical protein [Deltaproteobacteria bacterium]